MVLTHYGLYSCNSVIGIGFLLGVLTSFAPERHFDIAGLILKAFLVAQLVSFTTMAFAGNYIFVLY